MELPLFVVSTADSEGVLGVLSDQWYILLLSRSHHTPHKIFQDRFCHINAITTRKPETGSLVTDFRNIFGNK
jgi:hypothetical protein